MTVKAFDGSFRRVFFFSLASYFLKIAGLPKIPHHEIFVADTVKPNPHFALEIVQHFEACVTSPPTVFALVRQRIRFRLNVSRQQTI